MTPSKQSVSGPSSRPPAWGTVRTRKSETWGPDAADLMELAGYELLPWQRDTLDQMLEHDKDGRLTRGAASLIVPRRQGKTLLLLARMLFGIYAMPNPENRVAYTAQDNRTAYDVFENLIEVVERPAFARYVAPNGIRKANGSQRIDFTFPGGRKARFRPSTRTGSAGRGLEVDLLILDEAMYLEAEQMAALTPLVARSQAAGRGQIIATSSAGTVNSEVLAGIRDRGRSVSGTDGNGVAYIEYAADLDRMPDDVEGWYEANPSLGTAIIDEKFLRSQYAILTPEAFAREHLGRWAENASLPAISLDWWNECASSIEPEHDGGDTWLAFDVDYYRTSGRVIQAGTDTRGRVWMRLVEAWDNEHGFDEAAFARRVYEIAEREDVRAVGYDQATGERIADYLAKRRLEVQRLPKPKYAAACAGLAHAVRMGEIVHAGSPVLEADLSRAVPKPFDDGGWTFSRLKASTGPICGAIALALAYALATNPEEGDSDIYVRAS